MGANDGAQITKVVTTVTMIQQGGRKAVFIEKETTEEEVTGVEFALRLEPGGNLALFAPLFSD